MSIGSSVFAGFVTNRQTFQLVSTRPLDSVTSAYHYRSLRNKVDATSAVLTIHGIDITSAVFS